MADYKQGGKKITPDIDASLGLVMRLNLLWGAVDRKSLAGDLDGWNFTLDRIYCNLLYRNPMVAKMNGDKLVEVQITEEPARIYETFRFKIKKIKFEMQEFMRKRKRESYADKKEELYKTLMEKDIWLRKYMQELGLYLKEVEFNAATALWGGK